MLALAEVGHKVPLDDAHSIWRMQLEDGSMSLGSNVLLCLQGLPTLWWKQETNIPGTLPQLIMILFQIDCL